MSPRSYVARYFELEIDHTRVGFCKSVDGGAIKAEVVSQAVGGLLHKGKHIGVPTYEPFNVSVGMSMSKSFWQWVKDSWDGKYARKDGAIYTVDQNMNVVHEQSFVRALVTETAIPAMDAASKEPAYMSVKFQAEESRHKSAPGGKARSEYDPKQKLWLPSNFKLNVDGLDTSQISKIESFTIKQGVKRLEIGDDRDYDLEPTSLEFPNLTVTMSMASADSWFKWHEDFVIKGNNEQNREKGGSITMLSTSLRDQLLTVVLKHVGIYSITVDKGDAGSDSVKRVKVELYVEEMDLKY